MEDTSAKPLCSMTTISPEAVLKQMAEIMASYQTFLEVKQEESRDILKKIAELNNDISKTKCLLRTIRDRLEFASKTGVIPSMGNEGEA